MGGKCDYPVCPGHHHKFSDCQTEALHALSLHGGLYDDGQTGHVEWRIHATVFYFPESAQFSRESTGMEFDVYFPAGEHYIVYCDDRGHVGSTTFSSRTEAENAFAEIQRAYDAWDSQDGEE